MAVRELETTMPFIDGVDCIEELFTGKWRQFDQRPDSFAESQATFARIANEVAIDKGEHLLECIQGELIFLSQLRGYAYSWDLCAVQVLLTWFYHHQARYVSLSIHASAECSSILHTDGRRFVNSNSSSHCICPLTAFSRHTYRPDTFSVVSSLAA